MRHRRRTSVTRRKSRWEGGFTYLSSLSGAPGSVPTVAGSSAVTATWARVPAGAFDNVNGDFVLDDCTVYRMINTASFNFINSGTGGIDVTCGMGVIAWDSISDTPPSILDIPFPTQNGGADWLWWWVSPQFYGNSAAGTWSAVQNLLAPSSMVFTKSQRKLSTNTGLLLVTEVYANIDSINYRYGFNHHARYALKMP